MDNLTAARYIVGASTHNVSASQPNMSDSKPNMNASQHDMSTSQHNMSASQHSMSASQHSMSASQHNMNVSLHNRSRTPLEQLAAPLNSGTMSVPNRDPLPNMGFIPEHLIVISPNENSSAILTDKLAPVKCEGVGNVTWPLESASASFETQYSPLNVLTSSQTVNPPLKYVNAPLETVNRPLQNEENMRLANANRLIADVCAPMRNMEALFKDSMNTAMDDVNLVVQNMKTEVMDTIIKKEKQSRTSYTAAFKLQVIETAKEFKNNRSVARMYGLQESNVRKWCKEETKLRSMPANKQATRRSLPKYPELEEQLVRVIKCDPNGKLRNTQIQNMAARLATTMGIENFTGGPTWCVRFKKRHLSKSSTESHLHEDMCAVCADGGNVIKCDTCLHVYHAICLNPPLLAIPDVWFCPKCLEEVRKEKKTTKKILRLPGDAEDAATQDACSPFKDLNTTDDNKSLKCKPEPVKCIYSEDSLPDLTEDNILGTIVKADVDVIGDDVNDDSAVVAKQEDDTDDCLGLVINQVKCVTASQYENGKNVEKQDTVVLKMEPCSSMADEDKITEGAAVGTTLESEMAPRTPPVNNATSQRINKQLKLSLKKRHRHSEAESEGEPSSKKDKPSTSESDDRTVLNEADMGLCNNSSIDHKTPPKKRPETTASTVLAVSEFPTLSNARPAASPLELVEATENETSMTRIVSNGPVLSTPSHSDFSQVLNVTTPVSGASNDNSVSLSVRKYIDEIVSERDKIICAKYDQRIKQLEDQLAQNNQRLEDRDNRLTLCEQQIRLRDQRLNELEQLRKAPST